MDHDHTQKLVETALATLNSEFRGLSREDREDVAQNAVVQFWENLGRPTILSNDAPKSLLRSIAKRRAIDQYRLNKTRQNTVEAFQSETLRNRHIQGMPPSVSSRELAEAVQSRFLEIMNECNERDRLVCIVLLEQLSSEDHLTDIELRAEVAKKIASNPSLCSERMPISTSSVARSRRQITRKLAAALREELGIRPKILLSAEEQREHQ